MITIKIHSYDSLFCQKGHVKQQRVFVDNVGSNHICVSWKQFVIKDEQ